MRYMIFAPLLLVAGCGDDAATGGLTADESRQLNEAAAMLDDAPAALPVDAGNETPAPAD